MQSVKALLILLCLALAHNSIAQKLFEPHQSTLSEQWDLNDTESDNRGLFVIKTYKPVYLLAAKVSNNVNKTPQSGNPERNINEPIPLNKTEQKFQLSMKTKILNDVFGAKTGGDFWLTYTQVSFWQIFNKDLSRPFRETNYEPELLFILPTRYNFLGLEGAFVGVGINHQSNGRSNPYSRSWNRVVFPIAWEGRNTSVVLKPWLRLPEDEEENDNPDIEDFMGRAELMVAWSKGGHELSCQARHSLRFGENNRGSIQIDYSFRLLDNLKFHTQLFSGYGESMIDYNHRQTVIGIGFSLVGWR